MKTLVNKFSVSRKFQVEGVEVEVRQMPLASIEAFQEEIELLNANTELPEKDRLMKSQFALLRHSVIDAADLTDEDFKSFPPLFLRAVSEAAMEFNGLSVVEKKDGEDGENPTKTN